MPHKQYRKIIRVGNSLAITIPKPWLMYFDLTEKDQVTVLSNGNLTITPKENTRRDTTGKAAIE
jgi:antitoxin component of MazEF toxin-antitoxin module